MIRRFGDARLAKTRTAPNDPQTDLKRLTVKSPLYGLSTKFWSLPVTPKWWCASLYALLHVFSRYNVLEDRTNL